MEPRRPRQAACLAKDYPDRKRPAGPQIDKARGMLFRREPKPGHWRSSNGWLNMAVSIVTTLYKSAPYVDEFVARAKALMGDQDELIMVDDGSPDESLEIARKHVINDDRIVLVALSRNFGHHAAILAGLSQARHERIFLVDSDLEEEPELLREFSSTMDTSGVDVVFGIHDQSQGSISRRLTSKVFWRLFSAMTDTSLPLNICNVRLMNRRYVDALLSLPERNAFLGGMFHWVGFRQIA